MPLGGTRQESRGMPAPVTVNAQIAAEIESGAYVQAIGKTEFVTTWLWRPTCLKRNRRRVFEGSRRNDPFKNALAIRRWNWQLTTKRTGSVSRLTLARMQKEEFTCSVCTIGF